MATFDVCASSPADLLGSTLCLDEVSKDLRGELIPVDADPRECRDPECRSLTAEHALSVELSSHGCDSELGRLLDGRLVTKDLVTVFVGGSGERRGLREATFRWRTAAGLIHGQLSGMTNEGTHREPAFDPCQPCDARGVLEAGCAAASSGQPTPPSPGRRCSPRTGCGSTPTSGAAADPWRAPSRASSSAPAARSPAAWTSTSPGDDANPRSVGGLTVETRDLNGPTPATSVVTWGAWTGLHLWHEAEVVLPQPVARAEVAVVQFAVPPTVRALDAGGATIVTASATAPQQVRRSSLTRSFSQIPGSQLLETNVSGQYT